MDYEEVYLPMEEIRQLVRERNGLFGWGEDLCRKYGPDFLGIADGKAILIKRGDGNGKNKTNM